MLSNALPNPRVVPGHRAAVADPTREQWQDLVAPAREDLDAVVIGRRSSEALPKSLEEFREQVGRLDFLGLDPFVASVAASIGAGRVEIPKGEMTLEVSIPDYYAEGVEVVLGAHNGPGAPMLVILPGIHSDGEGSHSNLLKKLALERGMNYLVLPNSLNPEMLEDQPLYHPANPRVDALWSRQLIADLQGRYPDLFQHVSVAGYSYGALQAANLIRLDEESEHRVFDGSLVALSPPENLAHSMHQLDSLRERYQEGAGSISQTGLKYKHDVKKFGYERFVESELSQRGDGSNITEIKIADKYGSRDGLQEVVEIIDKQFHHNRLPRNTQEYKDASWLERRRLRQEHDRTVEEMTYEQFSQGWVAQDRWLIEHGLSPAELAERYSFSEALEAIDKTPVLMLASADDYILAEQDVQTLRGLEDLAGPLEIVRLMDKGGHVGLDWNPQVQSTVADFAYAFAQ